MAKPRSILTAILAGVIATAAAYAVDTPASLSPQVSFTPAPLKPSVMPPDGPSVLLGFSAFYIPDPLADVRNIYEPIREGGFRIKGGGQQFNRVIFHGQNRVWTGDAPTFRLSSFIGPTFLQPADPSKKPVGLVPKHSLGTVRLGVPGADGKIEWLDKMAESTTTSFFPGYTDYQIERPEWKASLRVASASGIHGMICRVEFDRDVPLVWHFGEVMVDEAKSAPVELSVEGSRCKGSDPDIANLEVFAGWDGEGRGQLAGDKQRVEFRATTAKKVYHIVANWGVTRLPAGVEETVRQNLMAGPAVKLWPESAEKLWQAWLACFVHPLLEPQKSFQALMQAPGAALEKTVSHWDARRNAFRISTPDEHLDALLNWARAVSDYHVQGPCLYLGSGYEMYSHTSNGWYGKEWAGDHEMLEKSLRFYATTQREKGARAFKTSHGGEIVTDEGGWIGWSTWNLKPWRQENNTPYWVDQVWQHYRWTGNKAFARDMWPSVQRAVSWECKQNDPDGDGLFTTYFPFWNGDSYAAMAKDASPTATGFAMLDAAARLAEAVGDSAAAAEYRGKAEKTRAAALRELWDDKAGVVTSVGADGLRGHPNSWAVGQAIYYGLLDRERGRRAAHWVESRYGFEGARPDVRLLMTSDLWPLRWSNHWAPVGDTFLNAMTGMQCGDVDTWWPYVKTVVHSAFRNKFVGIRFAINNAGVGWGDLEDVDADDPHMHAVVRGLFGVEPAIHNGELQICPAFPKDWKAASIKTPDLSYEYERQGDEVVFRIRTPRPLVKRVRANLTGQEVVTASEVESVVKIKSGPPLPALSKTLHPPSILANRQPKAEVVPLDAVQRERMVLVDLEGAYNIRAEELMATPMLFDNRQTPMPVQEWWVNAKLTMPPTPRLIETEHGVKFLTAGRPEGGDRTQAPKSLVALSSWRPYPWPAAIKMGVDRKCDRLWLLLQNYVHPSKCYVPNGEVVLRYKTGEPQITPLVPPYNLDCFYQVFSLEGVAVPFGAFDEWPPKRGYAPATQDYPGTITKCHATALEIKADPARTLESVELRATCGEGILGLAGMTLLETK